MARKPTFRELYEKGLAEPQTPYQKRIARGVDRGLTTAQARGHARTTKGEKSITQLRKAGKLPTPIGRTRNRNRKGSTLNNRHVLYQFEPGATPADIASFLREQSPQHGDAILFQLVVSDGDIRNARTKDGQRQSAFTSIHGMPAERITTRMIGQLLRELQWTHYAMTATPRYGVNLIQVFDDD